LPKETYLEQLQCSWLVAKASDPAPDADEYWEASVIRRERWYRLAHAVSAVAANNSAQSAQREDSQAEVECAHDPVSMLSCLPLGLPGDFGVRDSQFIHKLKRVKSTIESYEAQRNDSLSRRTDFTMQLRRMQHRITAVNVELVRVATFQGSFFTSSVMHGADQRFETVILKRELEKELAAVGTSQAQIKLQLIDDDNTRR
jgi:hypothetical protein